MTANDNLMQEAKHGPQIAQQRAQRQAMEKHFKNLKDSQKGNVADPEQEERMNSLLLQGRGKVVRHYAYDNPNDREKRS